VPVRTDPVRVMSPSFAVAATPSGTAPPKVSALVGHGGQGQVVAVTGRR
jgi:hypothetical protein